MEEEKTKNGAYHPQKSRAEDLPTNYKKYYEATIIKTVIFVQGQINE